LGRFWSVDEVLVLVSITFGVSSALFGLLSSPLLGLLLLALAAAVRWWFLLPFPMVLIGCVYVVFSTFFRAINLALLVGCTLELFYSCW
jgi:hypothetical protein